MGVILALILLLPQAPTGATPTPTPAPTTQKLGVEFDANGWPVAPSSRTAATGQRAASSQAPGSATNPAASSQPAGTVPAAPMGEVARAAVPDSGASTGSAPRRAGRSLAHALAGVGDAATFRSLGNVRIRWRVLVLGEKETVLGDREVRQWTDAMRGEHERLQFSDGRTFFRRGGKVEAERNGMPWPTLVPQATRELEFFVEQAGFPWRLMDSERFVEAPSDRSRAVDAAATSVRLVARDPASVMGPSVAPQPPRDAVEIVVPADSELPSEWCVESGPDRARRTIRLSDWRQVHGVKIPFQRTFLDAAGRPASRLQIESIEIGMPEADPEELPR